MHVEKITVTADQLSVEELLRIAASAEQDSTHILARSLVASAMERKADFAASHQLERSGRARDRSNSCWTQDQNR